MRRTAAASRSPGQEGRDDGRNEGRDRYLDALRALALVRVIIYHIGGGVLLTYLFPAMGVMFAMAGSLMAQSLDRSPARKVVGGRLRRLLPALWVLGAVVLPAMLWHGWPDHPPWPRLLLWVFPIAEPPGSTQARFATIVLWYLVTYLWLVLLSPAARWAYRRWPVPTVLLPLAALAGLEAMPGLLGGATGSVVTDLATFGACWVVGFTHRDGSLRNMARPVLLALAGASLTAGTAWAITHPTAQGVDLNSIPLAQALYSLGFVLLVLRVNPRMDWLSRVRPVDRLVTGLNARAVTVYLWHNLAITSSFVVGAAIGVRRWGKQIGDLGHLGITLALLLVAVLLFGWVEDLAARRSVRLLPWLPGLSRSAGWSRNGKSARPGQPAELHSSNDP